MKAKKRVTFVCWGIFEEAQVSFSSYFLLKVLHLLKTANYV